jgi:hypothetical protein
MKLVRKEQVGSRLLRRYEAPQTPFERVRACPDADPQKVAALEQVLTTTDLSAGRQVRLRSRNGSIATWSDSGRSPRGRRARRARQRPGRRGHGPV